MSSVSRSAAKPTAALSALIMLITALMVTATLSFSASAQAPAGRPGGQAGAPPAPGQLPPNQNGWRVTGGVGALVSNDYRGADSARIVPLPFLDMQYKRFFFNPGRGLGVTAINTRNGKWSYQLDVALAPQFANRDAGDIPGVDELEVGVEGRLAGRLGYGRWSLNVTGAHALFDSGTEGATLDVGVTYTGFFGKGGIWNVGPNIRFIDDATAQSFYRVTPRESRASGLDIHRTTGGAESVSMQGFLNYPLGGRWALTAIAQAGYLFDKYNDSPIVETRFQGTVITAITYRF